MTRGYINITSIHLKWDLPSRTATYTGIQLHVTIPAQPQNDDQSLYSS